MQKTGMSEGLWVGLAATGVMSLFMWAAQKTSRTGHLPPRKIAEAGLNAGGNKPHSESKVKALSTLAHFGFGGASGAAYGTAAKKMRISGVVPGIAFGLLVWATSYKGWIPALGIMPPPEKDRKARAVTMIIAHVIYGACLGAWVRPTNRNPGLRRRRLVQQASWIG